MRAREGAPWRGSAANRRGATWQGCHLSGASVPCSKRRLGQSYSMPRNKPLGDSSRRRIDPEARKKERKRRKERKKETKKQRDKERKGDSLCNEGLRRSSHWAERVLLSDRLLRASGSGCWKRIVAWLLRVSALGDVSVLCGWPKLVLLGMGKSLPIGAPSLLDVAG